MKFQVASLLFGACVVAAVNWNAIDEKVTSLEKAIVQWVKGVRSVVAADNPEVGAAIVKQLDGASAKAIEQLEKVVALSKAQTLTETQVKEHLGELTMILIDLRNHLKPHIGKLSPSAQKQVTESIEIGHGVVVKLVRDIKVHVSQ